MKQFEIMQRVFVGAGVLIASMLIGCGKNSIYVDDGEVNVIDDIPTLPKGDDGDDTTTLVQLHDIVDTAKNLADKVITNYNTHTISLIK